MRVCKAGKQRGGGREGGGGAGGDRATYAAARKAECAAAIVGMLRLLCVATRLLVKKRCVLRGI